MNAPFIKDIKMSQDTATIIQSDLDVIDKNELLKLDTCNNCGVDLNGQYCHSCGQSSKSMIKFFGEVIKELLDDTLGYDSRFKHSIVPLLFKPGRITLDYIKGKRSHYVLPFKLYLITSVLFILVIKNVIDTDALKINDIVATSDQQENKDQAKKEIDKEKTNADGDAKELLALSSNPDNKKTLIPDTSNKPENDATVLKKISEESVIKNLEKMPDNDLTFDIKNDVINEIKNDFNDDTKGIEIGDSDGFSVCNESGNDVNITWDSGKKKLVGLDGLTDSWCKSFAQVINPKLSVWIDKPKTLVDAIIELLPYMMFIILPFFAIFIKIFYLFSKRYYTEHLVFLLHNHSFIYFVLMLQIGLDFFEEKLKPIDHWAAQSAGSLISLLSSLFGFWLFIYVFLAMKRFYRQGWAVTIFKTMSLGFIYSIMLTVGFVIALAVGAYQA